MDRDFWIILRKLRRNSFLSSKITPDPEFSDAARFVKMSFESPPSPQNKGIQKESANPGSAYHIPQMLFRLDTEAIKLRVDLVGKQKMLNYFAAKWHPLADLFCQMQQLSASSSTYKSY